MGRTTIALALLLLALGAGPVGVQAEDEEEAEDAPRVRPWLETGSEAERVDVVFVGDGYQRRHLTRTGKYWRDVNRYARELFEERPFSSYQKMFNVYAVFLESKHVALKGETALGSYFGLSRGLRFRNNAALARALRAAPAVDIAFVMVNTERSGGAGTVLPEIQVRGRSLAAPTFSARDTISFQTALHEVGHSFAGLGDEYADAGNVARFPLPPEGRDLTQANLTLAAFIDVTNRDTIRATAKWGRFLDMRGAKRWAWAYEGGFYRESGVFRPFPRCRMRATADPFCPVCCEQVAKTIHEAAGATWDPEAHAKAHPLRLWR